MTGPPVLVPASQFITSFRLTVIVLDCTLGLRQLNYWGFVGAKDPYEEINVLIGCGTDSPKGKC